MRDKLRDKGYFDTFIGEELEDIQMFEDSIANGEIEEERVGSIKDDIMLIKLGIIIAEYSRGDAVDAIKREFEELTDLFCDIHEDEVYEDCLCIASLACLLGLDSEKTDKLRRRLMESDTYDYLMDFVLMGAESVIDKDRISFPRSYKRLAYCIRDNDREALLKYLRGWYKGSRESAWYDTHKIEDDNLYYGYWCFEAGAVAKRLGFDDSDLQDEPYYPYDMVHFS